MTTVLLGIALLVAGLPFCADIVSQLAADSRAAVDIDRIEAGLIAPADPLALTLVDPWGTCTNDPCTARHCAAHAPIHGTIAQRRHSRAAEQADVAVEQIRLLNLRWPADHRPLVPYIRSAVPDDLSALLELIT